MYTAQCYVDFRRFVRVLFALVLWVFTFYAADTKAAVMTSGADPTISLYRSKISSPIISTILAVIVEGTIFASFREAGSVAESSSNDFSRDSSAFPLLPKTAPIISEPSESILTLNKSLLDHFQKTGNRTLPYIFQIGDDDRKAAEEKSKKEQKRSEGRTHLDELSKPLKKDLQDLFPGLEWHKDHLPDTSQTHYVLPNGVIQNFSDKGQNDGTKYTKDDKDKNKDQSQSDNKSSDSKKSKSSGSTQIKKKPVVTTDTLPEKFYIAPLPAIQSKSAEVKATDQSLQRLILKTLAAEKKEKSGGTFEPVIQIRIAPGTAPKVYMTAVRTRAPEEKEDTKESSEPPKGAEASAVTDDLIKSLERDWQGVTEWLYTNNAVLIFEIKDSQLLVSHSHFSDDITEAFTSDGATLLFQTDLDQGAGIATIVDLHSPLLAETVYNLLNPDQAASLAGATSFDLVELDTWITRNLPSRLQFRGGLSTKEAIHHITQTLSSELILILTSPWLSKSMEETVFEQVVDIKVLWNGFSQEYSDKPLVVLAMLFSGEKAMHDHLKKILRIDTAAAQKIIPRDELFRISGMPAGSVCLFIMPAGGTDYVCVTEQQILDLMPQLLAFRTENDPTLFITGGGCSGAQIAVTDQALARHLAHLQTENHYASGQFRETEADRKANEEKTRKSQEHQKKVAEDKKRKDEQKKIKEKEKEEKKRKEMQNKTTT